MTWRACDITAHARSPLYKSYKAYRSHTLPAELHGSSVDAARTLMSYLARPAPAWQLPAIRLESALLGRSPLVQRCLNPRPAPPATFEKGP
jgi:hypothetical protein